VRELVRDRAHLGRAGLVVRGGHEQRELGCAGLRLGRREGRLVAGHDVRGQLAGGRALDHEAHRQVGIALGEVAPRHEALRHTSREQSGVEDHEACDAAGVLDRPAKPDRPAPVLDDHGRPTEIQRAKQRRDELHVALVAVPAPVGGLVGAAEARVVGADHPPPGGHQRSDHLPVQEGPRGLTVEAHDRVAGARVHVVQARAIALEPVRLEAIAGQAHEALVRGPEYVAHGR